MNAQSTPLPILWRQVWALAALLAAILFCTTIYGFYQPTILTDLGFVGLTDWLSVVQGFLGALVEPLFGKMSDTILLRTGSRLPQVTVGVITIGLLFVIVAFVLPTSLASPLRWLVLLLMLVWLVAAIAIRGPIVALLGQLAPIERLPAASQVLTLVITLVGAANYWLNYWLAQWGVSVAFVLGAIAVTIVAAWFYRTLSQPIAPPDGTGQALVFVSAPCSPQTRQRLLLMPLVGGCTGGILHITLTVVPATLQDSLPIGSTAIASVILFLAAVVANPLGRQTQRWGAAIALQRGIGCIVVLLLLANLRVGIIAVLLLAGFGFAFCLVFISTVPFALSYVPLQQAGLSVGLFFGGSNAGTALLLLLQQQGGELTAIAGVGLAAIAFGTIAPCLQIYHPSQPQR